MSLAGERFSGRLGLSGEVYSRNSQMNNATFSAAGGIHAPFKLMLSYSLCPRATLYPARDSAKIFALVRYRSDHALLSFALDRPITPTAELSLTRYDYALPFDQDTWKGSGALGMSAAKNKLAVSGKLSAGLQTMKHPTLAKALGKDASTLFGGFDAGISLDPGIVRPSLNAGLDYVSYTTGDTADSHYQRRDLSMALGAKVRVAVLDWAFVEPWLKLSLRSTTAASASLDDGKDYRLFEGGLTVLLKKGIALKRKG